MKRTCYITKTSSLYCEIINELSNAYKNNTLCLLCGAGISFFKPSRLPGGWDLREELSKMMVDCIRKSGIKVDYDKALRLLGIKPLESLLDSLVNVFSRNALKYISNMDIYKWNPDHYYIAYLAHNNRNFKIITLNFDVLIESVLDRLNSDYTIITPLTIDDINSVNSKLKDTIGILKPHGSFSRPGDIENRFKNITTTLGEIRDKPDNRTIYFFQKFLKSCTHLIVAGYGGEDWDIMPILGDICAINKNLKLVWVKHYNQGKINVDANIPSDVFDTILTNLTYKEINIELLLGDSFYLLKDVCENIFYKDLRYFTHPGYSRNIRKMDKRIFYENKASTILAATELLHDSDHEMTERLLQFLEGQPEITNNPQLLQHFYNVKAWWHYIEKEHDIGLKYRNDAIDINIKVLNKTEKVIVKDIISTGYQYVSYSKPRRFTMKEIILSPIYLFKGFHYLKKGEKLSDSIINKAFSYYYRIDYFHTWSLLLLLFGYRKCILARRKIFRIIYNYYCDVDSKYGDHMDREYFFLRKIESLVLSGLILNDQQDKLIKNKIAMITNYFYLTKQVDHLRNVCVANAFLKFMKDPKDPDIEKFLKYAFLEKKDINENEKVPINNDNLCFKYLIILLKESESNMQLTKSAIMRYSLFFRFFNPDNYSFKQTLQSFNIK